MKGLPGALLNKLKRIMLECGPFASQSQLLTVFADDRISTWKYEVPEADTIANRVDHFVSKFYDRYNRLDQNVLVLFLQALYDRRSSSAPEDKCVDRLYDIAVEMAVALESDLPPLARNNLVRVLMVRTGEEPAEDVAGYIPPVVAPDLNPFYETLPSNLSTNRFAVLLESLKNKQRADWLPVNFLEKGLTAARAVGRVEYQGQRLGTAFLVAPDLVLTSAHVVRKILELGKGGVRFNVGLEVAEQWHYFVEEVANSPIEELDFSLLRLKTPTTSVPVSFSAEWAYSNQYANILQHPKGDSMQVALRYNAVVHADMTRFYYVTDTEEGSSGSPIFNDAWQVVGLHRAGIVDEDNRPVKNANQGVPFLAIKPHIQSYL